MKSTSVPSSTQPKTFSLHPVSLIAGGLFTLAGVFAQQAPVAEETEAPGALRAQSLEIVNEAGEVVAVLDARGLLIGKLEGERIQLALSEDRAEIKVQGPAAGGGLVLQAGAEIYTGLQMTSPKDEALVSLGIARFGVNEPLSGGLVVRRDGMQPSVLLKTDNHGGFVSLENWGGRFVTLAANQGGHGTVTTARADGNPSAFLGSSPQGQTAMELYATDQTPILVMGEAGGAATLSLSGDGSGQSDPRVTLHPRAGKAQSFPPYQR